MLFLADVFLAEAFFAGAFLTGVGFAAGADFAFGGSQQASLQPQSPLAHGQRRL